MNITGAFLWGITSEKKGINNTLLLLVILSFVGGIVGFFSNNRIIIIIFTILFGLMDRGMETIVGPALVEIFGTKTASLLLPYKGMCFLLSNLISPILQIITSYFLDAFSQLKFLYIFCVISFIMGVYYKILHK
jgi:MFS family permease